MTSVGRGQAGEQFAAIYLELCGLTILDRNRRAAGGEVDIIARERDALVFVEVRLRRRGQWVSAGRSITTDKQSRLRACARELARRPELQWPGRLLRLDVVLLELGAEGLQLWHHRNVHLAPGLPRRGRNP